MFDPTIYENLKVVFEGAAYDLDMSGSVSIVDRHDTVDLATMSRTYAITLATSDRRSVRGTLQLEALLADFAGEQLAIAKAEPGCRLQLRFSCTIAEEAMCSAVHAEVAELWGAEAVSLQLTKEYDSAAGKLRSPMPCTVTVSFARKITEAQIEDIPELLDHLQRTFEALTRFAC